MTSGHLRSGVRQTGGSPIEWTKSAVVFILDGMEIGRCTKQPTKPMHHVIQIETNLDGVKPTQADDGYVYLGDYVVWSHVEPSLGR